MFIILNIPGVFGIARGGVFQVDARVKLFVLVKCWSKNSTELLGKNGPGTFRV